MHPLLPLHFFSPLTNSVKKTWVDDHFRTPEHPGLWPFKKPLPVKWKLAWGEAVELAHTEHTTSMREGYKILTYVDDDYPHYLKEIVDPPMALFGRGRWNNQKIPLSVVGTRKISHYGKNVSRSLAVRLSEFPVNLVSGLAIGVDAAIHENALAMGATTTAFLAGGMAEISPPRHTRLAAQIVDQSGGYFTEQPFHRAPTAGLFPVRNRLIAGASLATVVVEAARKSGALITANMAHKYHRSVFAVPGAWFMPYSQGPNALIEEQLAEAVVDLDRFPGRFYPPWAKNNELFDLSGGIEEALIKLLPHGRIVNSLQFRERLGVPNNMIFSGLRTLLELGLVERIGPDTYRRKMD